MIFKNKLINLITVFVFLFNIMLSDVSQAQTFLISQENLSPVLRCNDLLGVEHKDLFRIQFALKPHLEMVNRKEFKKLIPDMDMFKSELGYRSGRENTVFYPSEVQFFYNEAERLPNGDICVMCRVVDPNKKKDLSQAERTRTYYVVVSIKHGDDAQEFYCKGIYTLEEYNRVKGELSLLSSREPEDELAINRYALHNENIIDAFIINRIRTGNFAEINLIRSVLSWDKNFPGAISPKKEDLWPSGLYDKICKKHLSDFLSIFGTSFPEILRGKNLVFVRVPEDKGYPSVSIKINSSGYEVVPGEKGEVVDVNVLSHASNNAVYIFMKPEEFDLFSSASKLSLEKGTTAFFDDKVILESIIPSIIHEAGVVHGLKAYYREGKIINYLDKAWEIFAQNNYSVEHFLSFTLPGMIKKYPELDKIKKESVDLDSNLLTRDYMMGKKKKGSVKKNKVKKKIKKKANNRKQAGKKEKRMEAKPVPAVEVDMTKIANKEQAAYMAYLRIFDISPSSPRNRDKGVKSVLNFLSRVKGFTDSSTYISLKWFMETDVIRKKINSREFDDFLTDERFSNFMHNVWNAYTEKSGEDNFDLLKDDLARRLLFLLSDLYSNRHYKKIMKSVYEDREADADIIYMAMFSLLFGTNNTRAVIERFRTERRMAQELRAKLTAKNVKKLKSRLLKAGDDRAVKVIRKVQFDQQMMPEVFMSRFRKEAMAAGMDAKVIEELLINAAEKDADTMALKLLLASRGLKELRDYLYELEPSKKKIKSSTELVARIKEKFPDLAVEGGAIDNALIQLASSDMGDMIYIQDVIKVSKLSDRDLLNREMRRISDLTGDFDTLVRFSDLLDLNTNPDMLRLYLKASLIDMLERKDKNMPSIGSGKELLIYISDEIYGKNVGMTTLLKVYPDNADIQGSMLMELSGFVKKYVKLRAGQADVEEAELVCRQYLRLIENMRDREANQKEISDFKKLLENLSDIEDISSSYSDFLTAMGDYDKAAKILETNLAYLEKGENAGKNKHQIMKLIEILNELYLNKILHNIISIYSMPRGERMFGPNIQEKLLLIVKTDHKRKALWSDRGKPVPVGVVGLNQSLFALMNYLSDDPDENQRNYAEVLNSFEKQDAWELVDLIKSEKSSKISIPDFFNLYMNAAVLNTDFLREIESSGKPVVEYCVEKLFGEKRVQEALNLLYPNRNDLVAREKGFIKIMQSMRAYNYEKQDEEGILKVLQMFSRYCAHQISSIKDKTLLREIFSDKDIVEFYLLARASDIGDLSDLFENGKSFIPYFLDPIFGEGEGDKAASRILGGEKDLMGMERMFLSLPQIVHSSYYEKNDFEAMEKGFWHYRKLFTHQKRTLKGEYSISDVLVNNDITFYCFMILFDVNLMEELSFSGKDIISFIGDELFSGTGKRERVIDILKQGETHPFLMEELDYSFLDAYDEIIGKAFKAGNMDKAFEFIDLYSTFIRHQVLFMKGEMKEYYEKISIELGSIKDRMNILNEGDGIREENIKEALNLWESRVSTRRKELKEARIASKKAREAAELEQKEREAQQARERAEAKRAEEIKKLEAYRSKVDRKMKQAEFELAIAKHDISWKMILSAREHLALSATSYDVIGSFIEEMRKDMRDISEDLESERNEVLRDYKDRMSGLKTKIKKVFRDFAEAEKEYLSVREKARGRNEQRIAQYKSQMEKDLAGASDIYEKFDSMLEEAAEGIVMVSDQRLLDARKSLDKVMSFDGSVDQYISLLKIRKKSIRKDLNDVYDETSAEFRELFLEFDEQKYLEQQKNRMDLTADEWGNTCDKEIKALENKRDEIRGLTVKMLNDKIEEETRAEAADLGAKWRQVEDNITVIKDIIQKIYGYIKEKKLQAAARLFHELENEKMPYHMKPMEGYISLLDFKISKKGREDLVPVKEEAVEHRRREVEACVKSLEIKLKEAQEEFAGELELLRERETALYDKAAGCFAAMEISAKAVTYGDKRQG